MNERAATPEEFCGDPEDIPLGGLIIFCVLLFVVVPMTPFVLRWLAGQL